MAKGVNIPIAADASGVIKGTRDVEEAFDEVAEVLEDVSTAGKDTERDLDRSMGDVERTADKAADRLERSFRDAFDDVRKDSRRAGDDVGDNVKKGARKAEDAVEEFGDEAKQNFSEVASSFSGDMDSAIDLVQGTLGGLAGSIPGVGLALGGLGAAAGAFYHAWQENTEAVKEDVSNMYDDLLQSGADYLSQDYQQTVYWEILKGESKLLNARNLAKIASWSAQTEETVALAYAGNIEMMTRVTDGLIDRRSRLQAQLEDEDFANDSAAKSGIAYINEMIDGLDRRKTKIEETTTAFQRQKTFWDRYNDDTEVAYNNARTQYQGLVSDLEKTVRPSIKPELDFSEAERQLRSWRPSVNADVYSKVRSGRPVP